MGLAMIRKLFSREYIHIKPASEGRQNLTNVQVNRPYVIKGIDTDENSIKHYLFTLGCFTGEKITVISVLAENYIIHVKDARYSIDVDLAKAILV